MTIIIQKITRKEYRRANPELLYVSDGKHEYLENGDHLITIIYHANSNVILHELGHAKLDHRAHNKKTFRELFKREIDAEIFVYKTKGKQLSFNILIPAIGAITFYHYLYANELFNMCLDCLNSYNIPYDKNDKRRLWHVLKKDCPH